MDNLDQLPDVSLCSLLQEGNREAYGIIFNRYHGVLYRHAFRMLGDAAQSHDIVQEVFQYLWIKRADITFHTSLSAYLYQSTRNAVLNEIKRSNRQQKHIDAFANYFNHASAPADEHIRLKQLQALIDKEINHLPPRMREIFILRKEESLSYGDIASRLGISNLTVKGQLNKALKILKRRVLYFF